MSKRQNSESQPTLLGLVAVCLTIVALCGYTIYAAIGHGYFAGRYHDAQAIATIQPADTGFGLQRMAAINGCKRTYEFEVNGEKYTGPTGNWRIPSRCDDLDSEIPVTYDSRNPADNVWAWEYNNKFAVGTGIAGIVLSLGIFIVKFPKCRR